jgi:VWFA-related protein
MTRRRMQHLAWAGSAVASLVAAAWLAPVSSATSPGTGAGFSIRITSPAPDDFVLGRSRLAAEVSIDEPKLIAKVEFYVDDRLIFIDKEPPYEVVHAFGDEPRPYVIRVEAYRADGVTVSSTVVTRRLVINYRTEVDRVVLNATATDSNGRFLLDLTRDEFAVTEDGVPQEILEFTLEERPVTLALVLDTSGSMRDAIGEAQQAADRFVDTLKGQEQALVIDFDQRVFLLQELTTDKVGLKKAIDSTYAEGGTAIYDALFSAFRLINPIDGRKAIVLVTDGDDHDSQFSLQRIVETARTSNVTIYGVGLGSAIQKGPLKQLTTETGGEAFFPSAVDKLAGVYEQVAQELRSQYLLAYTSTNKTYNGKFREVKIKSTRSGVEVRTRRGYYGVIKAEE